MKVGKEQLAGLFVALTEYVGRDEAALGAARDGIVAALQSALGGVPGLRTAIRADEAGRQIRRLALAREDGGDIRELVRFLARGTPCIRVREHHLDDGIALLDPRELGATQVAIIAARVGEFFAQVGERGRTAARPRRR
jgi:L-seryl-tRNA(Ser) seleniumtransferase